jgi:hypothetical protein
MQEYKHDPENGIYGDCARTCLAALLEVPNDNVPHFLWDNPSGEVFNRRLDIWMAQQALSRFIVTFPREVELEALLAYMKHMNPGVYVCLVGQSKLGCNHIVITLDGEIVMDPSGNGIVGPCDDGFWYVETYSPIGFTNKKVSAEDAEWLATQFQL